MYIVGYLSISVSNKWEIAAMADSIEKARALLEEVILARRLNKHFFGQYKEEII